MPALRRSLRLSLFVAAVCVPSSARGQASPSGPLEEAARLDDVAEAIGGAARPYARRKLYP